MENFIQKHRAGNSTLTERIVLINNGIFYLYNQALIELSQIDECREEIIKEFESFQEYILIAQLSILLSFFVLQAWFISIFIKGSNAFWNKISQHAYNSFFDVKVKCCERLLYLLQVPEKEVEAYNEMGKHAKNEFAITYTQIGGYCWRFSMLFILASLYLGVFYSIFSRDINFVSEEKRTLFNSVSFMKFDLQRVENYSLFKLYSNQFFEKFYAISLKDYEKYKKRTFSYNLGKLKNGKLYDYFFDNVSGEGFLKFGLNSAANWIIIQSNELKDFQSLESFYENNLNTCNLFDAAIDEIVEKGDSKIDRIYQNVVLAMVTYIVSCVLFCALIYFPYITRKGKKMFCFQSVFQLLVINDTYTKLQSIPNN